MSRELSGKRVLLTGATGGIGRATANALANAGARLALAARNPEKLQELAALLPGSTAVPADLTQPEQRQRLVDSAVAALGGLDILVNNAGIGSWGHFATSTEDIVRQVMEVNFFAPIELTRLALP